MKEHDPRCEGGNDQKLLDDVAEYGWHVMKVLDDDNTPGWAYSIGLYKNFQHPEILIFGLESDLMHSIINYVGENIRSGKAIEIDGKYPDLIETYSCTFKTVRPVWYESFLGFATWFYGGVDYPVLQCFWPDFESRYPWDPNFDPEWWSDQPLLFHEKPAAARAQELLASLESL